MFLSDSFNHKIQTGVTHIISQSINAISNQLDEPYIEIQSENNADAWSSDKLRGFKRKQVVHSEDQNDINVGRNSTHSNNTSDVPNHSDKTDNSQNINTRNSDQSDHSRERILQQSQNQQISRIDVNNSDQICRFFATTGWCKFEERTERKCKFIHSFNPGGPKVPICGSGINCTRYNCNFSHPRPRTIWHGPSDRSFLGNQNRSTPMNPWQDQHQNHQVNMGNNRSENSVYWTINQGRMERQILN